MHRVCTQFRHQPCTKMQETDPILHSKLRVQSRNKRDLLRTPKSNEKMHICRHCSLYRFIGWSNMLCCHNSPRIFKRSAIDLWSRRSFQDCITCNQIHLRWRDAGGFSLPDRHVSFITICQKAGFLRRDRLKMDKHKAFRKNQPTFLKIVTSSQETVSCRV